MLNNLLKLSAGILLIAVFVKCQNAATPQSCPDAQFMQNFSASQFNGTWYEAARLPALPNISCVMVNITTDNSSASIQTQYANSSVQVQPMTATVTLEANSTGYNVSYAMGSTVMAPITFKVLDTDYSSFAYVCGFTNATDNSTFFGVLLVRNYNVNSTTLNNYEQTAQGKYSDFGSVNQSMSVISQSDTCYMNSASTLVPALGVLFLTLYHLLKMVV